MLMVNGRVIEIKKFPDGTLSIKEEPSYDRALLTWRFESNEELVALIFVVQHLRSHGVKNISLRMSYIPNARQDRVQTAEDVFTLKHFAWVINSLKFDKVFVLDPHSSVSEALIENLHIESPADIIKKVYSKITKAAMNPEGKTTMIFYPDEGAVKRYSGMVPVPYAFGIKERELETGRIKELSIFSSREEIADRNILIVDDICSRGDTFYYIAKKLKELGANRIFLFVTHCENAIHQGDVLTCGLFDRVYTTNSLLTKGHEKIEVVSL